MMRYSLLIFTILFLVSPQSFAQEKSTEINQFDAQGKQHGLWYTSTPALRGEPAENTFGNYEHGNKSGIWYIGDEKGNIMSIETFKWNVKDGEAKYFENGRLSSIGHFRGLNPREAMDTFVVVDPETGNEKLVSVPTEWGSVRHGFWRFYDEFSGRLIKEEEYQIDELIFSKQFTTSTSDSTHYQRRDSLLPHHKNKIPASQFKPKSPTKSLIGN